MPNQAEPVLWILRELSIRLRFNRPPKRIRSIPGSDYSVAVNRLNVNGFSSD